VMERGSVLSGSVRRKALTAAGSLQVEVFRQDLRKEDLIGTGKVIVDGKWRKNEFDGKQKSALFNGARSGSPLGPSGSARG